jgi:DNA polymerase-1
MNLQNIPRDDKTIKRAIIPKLGALSFFDYSQIEPRLFAYYACKMGYPEMAKMLADGMDSYTAVAKLIEQKDDITDIERQTWKKVFLSLMYGGGKPAIQMYLECSRAEATKAIDTFHSNFPAVRSIQDTVARVVARRGYIVGIDGRYLHVEKYGEHKMLNKLIQGGAAGIMKQAIVKVHKELRAAWDCQQQASQIISVVHDELQIDGPENELEWLHEIVPPLMVHEEVNSIVPITVGHEVSTTSWADKVDYDEWKEAA